MASPGMKPTTLTTCDTVFPLMVGVPRGGTAGERTAGRKHFPLPAASGATALHVNVARSAAGCAFGEPLEYRFALLVREHVHGFVGFFRRLARRPKE